MRARPHLATAIQIFDVVSMSSEMGCIVTIVTVRKGRQKKTYRCCQVRTDLEGYFLGSSHFWRCSYLGCYCVPYLFTKLPQLPLKEIHVELIN